MIYQFINLIKAIASCLVANSHFDGIWPISALATGGSLGNCLFFAASGFLLGSIKQDFIPWYLKKLVRIYPAIWIITTISLFFRNNLSLGGLLGEYFFSSHYWFLQALIVLYIPFYFVMRGKLKEKLPFVIAGVSVLYFICYFAFKDIHAWSIESAGRFKWIFYFIVFLIGGGYSLRIKNHQKIPERRVSVCITLLAVVAFYGFKFVLDRKPALMPLQFLEQAFLGVFVYYLIPFLLNIEPGLKKVSKKKWWKAVTFMSSITLEVFLVMDYVIDYVEVCKFPLSLMSAVVGIVIGAWILHLIQTPISNWLTKVVQK